MKLTKLDKKSLLKLMPIGIIVLGLIIFTIIIISKPKAAVKPNTEISWPVEATTIQNGTYTPYLVLYGRIESPEMAEKKARIEADVARVDVREGEKVKKGQVLLQLDDRELQLLWQQRKADVDDLKAQIQAEKIRYQTDQASLKHEAGLVAIAEKNVYRREHLVKTLAGSELALDQAKEELRRRELSVVERQKAIDDHINRLSQLQAKLSKAEALLGLTNIEVEKTTVKAPFDGRVIHVNVSTGDRVKPGDELLQIFDSRWTEVRCQIPEQYIISAQKAVDRKQKVIAHTDIHGKAYTLVLNRLAGRAEKGRLGVDALFRFTQSVPDAVIGSTIPLRVNLLPQSNVYALPLTAIFGGDKVYKIEDQRLVEINVQKIGMTSIKNKDYYLIKSAELKNGDQIITTQLPNVITGLRVEVKSEQ